MPPVCSPPISLPEVEHSHDATPGGGNKPSSFALSHIDCSHPYLAGRGIDPETARHFGIGYNRGQGSMADRIVIPIHDENGFLVAYAGRSVDETDPKYRFPPRFRKSLVLFNLRRAAAHGESVVVVEGFLDCIKVHQAGLPCVVALMGAHSQFGKRSFCNNIFGKLSSCSTATRRDGVPASRWRSVWYRSFPPGSSRFRMAASRTRWGRTRFDVYAFRVTLDSARTFVTMPRW